MGVITQAAKNAPQKPSRLVLPSKPTTRLVRIRKSTNSITDHRAQRKAKRLGNCGLIWARSFLFLLNLLDGFFGLVKFLPEVVAHLFWIKVE